MILVSFCSEDNALSDEIKICYIFEYQSNENRAFRFLGHPIYSGKLSWNPLSIYTESPFSLYNCSFFRDGGVCILFRLQQNKYITHRIDLLRYVK